MILKISLILISGVVMKANMRISDRFTNLTQADLTLRSDEDFWCIGKNAQREQLDHIDSIEFVTQNIRALLPLYEACHK